jgi:hypothetical protein
MITITFDDAVNNNNIELYNELFNGKRKNPNGCNIKGTFFLSHKYANYSAVQVSGSTLSLLGSLPTLIVILMEEIGREWESRTGYVFSRDFSRGGGFLLIKRFFVMFFEILKII